MSDPSRKRGRPYQCRRITGKAPEGLFKPAGIPMHQLELVMLTLDELEAMRLVDLEGLYQEAAGERMGVSRPTLGRILASGRQKVAEAMTLQKALQVEGGEVEIIEDET